MLLFNHDILDDLIIADLNYIVTEKVNVPGGEYGLFLIRPFATAAKCARFIKRQLGSQNPKDQDRFTVYRSDSDYATEMAHGVFPLYFYYINEN
jgi:hypothetical protein